MRWLTEDAVLTCLHGGLVKIVPTQGLVTIAGRRVLVETNPENCVIGGCPFTGPMIKPCTNTLVVTKGYSQFLRVSGRRVCLDTITGLTDGTPPGKVEYVVRAPGQSLLQEGAG